MKKLKFDKKFENLNYDFYFALGAFIGVSIALIIHLTHPEIL